MVIKDGEPISLESGVRLATWAKGGASEPPAVDWQARITAARTKEELRAIGRQLKAASGTMPAATLETLRRSYDAALVTTTAHGGEATP